MEAALAEREEGAQAGIAGVQEPQGVYLACYRLLREPGDDRAPAGPSEAFTELQRRAGTLDEEARRLYLEAVPANRAIVKAWRGQRNPR